MPGVISIQRAGATSVQCEQLFQYVVQHAGATSVQYQQLRSTSYSTQVQQVSSINSCFSVAYSTQVPLANAPDELCMIIAVGLVVSASHDDQCEPPGNTRSKRETDRERERERERETMKCCCGGRSKKKITSSISTMECPLNQNSVFRVNLPKHTHELRCRRQHNV
jgi:hypothetical protein